MTDSKSEVNRIAKTSSKGIMGANTSQKALQNQVSSRPNHEGRAPRTTELSIKYSFSRKTQHLSRGSKGKMIKL